MSLPRGIFSDGARGELVEHWQFRYTVSTEPATEPVTRDEAKLFARIDITDDDALVDALITAARITVEDQTGRKFITQTIDAYMDSVPTSHAIELSHRPIASVTTIEAINDDDSTDALDSGDIVLDGANARIGIKDTASPIVGTRSVDSFHIQYVAGYGNADAVPEWAKLVIKQIVSHWYEHRETALTDKGAVEIPYATQLIIDSNKVTRI